MGSTPITTQVYGKWLPKKPVRGGAALLDDNELQKIPLLGSKVGNRSPGVTQRRAKKLSEPCWTRTNDPLIKRQFYSPSQQHREHLIPSEIGVSCAPRCT
jgi:hypothetical protein